MVNTILIAIAAALLVSFAYLELMNTNPLSSYHPITPSSTSKEIPSFIQDFCAK